VIDDESEKSVEESQVYLFVDFLPLGLEQDDTFVILHIPHLRDVVHSLTPLVDQQRRRLRVRWLNPVRKQIPLLSLVPQILIQIRI
jgi:hypothetical protein